MGEFVHVYNDGGGIRNVPMREGATRFTTDRVLYQSGIPFWIPPGDGGSNGLSLAADGTFTLSAEAPMASAFNVFASGGYIYLPAGAGGLTTGGWFERAGFSRDLPGDRAAGVRFVANSFYGPDARQDYSTDFRDYRSVIHHARRQPGAERDNEFSAEVVNIQYGGEQDDQVSCW